MITAIVLGSMFVYVVIVGAVWSGFTKWMEKTDYHARRKHYDHTYSSCDVCGFVPWVVACLWPLAIPWYIGNVLATKKRVKKATKVAKRIADLEHELFA